MKTRLPLSGNVLQPTISSHGHRLRMKPHNTGVDQLPEGQPGPQNVQPIIFHSRTSTPTEKRYWPTEAELAGIIWAARKVRHAIESSLKPAHIITNHAAALGIVQQATLTSSSTMCTRDAMDYVFALFSIQNLDLFDRDLAMCLNSLMIFTYLWCPVRCCDTLCCSPGSTFGTGTCQQR